MRYSIPAARILIQSAHREPNPLLCLGADKQPRPSAAAHRRVSEGFRSPRSWQDTAYVLALFGRSASEARRLVAYLATRELSIPGSEVARRFNQDRSAVAKILKELIDKS